MYISFSKAAVSLKHFSLAKAAKLSMFLKSAENGTRMILIWMISLWSPQWPMSRWMEDCRPQLMPDHSASCRSGDPVCHQSFPPSIFVSETTLTIDESCRIFVFFSILGRPWKATSWLTFDLKKKIMKKKQNYEKTNSPERWWPRMSWPLQRQRGLWGCRAQTFKFIFGIALSYQQST